MKTIYKYPLDVTDQQGLKLPWNSKILSVAEQNNQIVLYALVNTSEERIEQWLIFMRGTGHDAEDMENTRFLGTVKLRNGSLMFHVFCE
jgi:hypothetical protein